MSTTNQQIRLVETYAAHNYHPLEIVLTEGEGAWLPDVDGRRYLASNYRNVGNATPFAAVAAFPSMGLVM